MGLVIENLDVKLLQLLISHAQQNINGLEMKHWHGGGTSALTENNWCGTTHCRAGFIVCMAGKEALEKEGVETTCSIADSIYQASSPDVLQRFGPLNYYSTNPWALFDIVRRAKFKGFDPGEEVITKLFNYYRDRDMKNIQRYGGSPYARRKETLILSYQDNLKRALEVKYEQTPT